MSPAAEPKTCCVVEDGKECGDWAMYKIGAKGFCEKHKPKRQTVASENPPRHLSDTPLPSVRFSSH